jgi:hypothetical protein
MPIAHEHCEQNTSKKHENKQAQNATPVPASRLDKIDWCKNGPDKENKGLEITWRTITPIACVGANSQCDAQQAGDKMPLAHQWSASGPRLTEELRQVASSRGAIRSSASI